MPSRPDPRALAPLYVVVGRGAHVESCHRVYAVVADGDGCVTAAHGDGARPIFPRSAVKAIQALLVVESGAADAFGFTPAELALTCASHAGTPLHVETARGMLAKAGLDATALACGAHWPLDETAARDLARGGAEPGSLHNNCSGKHAGFLAVAAHLGYRITGYETPHHPVQERVAAILAEMTGAPITAAARAIDGCSVPTWAVPLERLAVAFARLGSGAGLAPGRAAAAARLRAAVAAHPLLVAGPGRFDTRVMEACGERLFVKIGAEGVLCAAIPAAGVGIAVKAEDGAARAAEVAMASLLLRHLPSPTERERHELDRLRAPGLSNWKGLSVGWIRMEGEPAV